MLRLVCQSISLFVEQALDSGLWTFLIQTTEAEMTSLHQQKRIEELDAELHEAEGVIVDLRAEVKKAHELFLKLKNSHMLQSNRPSENKHIPYIENTTHDKKLDVTEAFRSSSQSGRSCKPAKENITSNPLSDNFISKPNLASIIIGSKEPEFSRNGYTRRMQAIERNLVDRKTLSADKPAGDICARKKLTINVDEKTSKKCAPGSIDADITHMRTDMNNINGSEALCAKSSAAKVETAKTQRLPTNSVRSTRSKPRLSRFSHGHVTNPTSPEKVNLEEIHTKKGENSTENNEKSSCTLRRSVRKRKLRCWDGISSLFKSRAALYRGQKYSGNDRTETDEHQCSFNSVAEINEGIISMPSSTNASEETSDVCPSRPLQLNAVKDTELQNKSMVETHEVGVQITEADKLLRTDPIPYVHAGTACDTDKNRCLKYTFSRKRKKTLSSKFQ